MSLPTTFNATATGIVFGPVQVGSFQDISLVLSGTWVGTVNIQVSNDNITYNSLPVYDDLFSSFVYTGNMTYNSIFCISCSYLYVQINVTAYTSGTINGAVFLAEMPVNRPYGTQVVSITGGSNNIGSVNQAAASNPWFIAGKLTNNNAAPGANNAGVLPALANAAAPAWTEGDQVLESVDLAGNTRVKVSNANANGQATSANSSPVVLASDQSTLPIDLSTSKGVKTTFIAAGTSADTVIKATPGVFWGIFASTVAAGAGLVYDNATTHTGTPIGSAPTAIGFDQGIPSAGIQCVNGITVTGSATNPALTVFWE